MNNFMNLKRNNQIKREDRNGGDYRPLCLSALALLALGTVAQAQTFTTANNDLALGFRKNNPYTENYEVVVNIGQASSYFNLALGTTISVPGFSATQLTNSFASFSNLSWSAFGGYTGSSYPGYVNNTLWLTVPRANNAVRSSDALRLAYSLQQAVKAKMGNIVGGSSGAGFISLGLGASAFNTATFVREPIATYGTHILSVWMSGTVDPTQGTLNDAWPPSEPNGGNLEVTTPGSFTNGMVRADLYEVRPLTTATGTTVVDPHTGTSGLAWYMGYFQFNSDGTMTFTRETASTAPAQVNLSIARTDNTSAISFGSSSGVTYKLFFTNSAGLSTPVSNWPSQSGTISGDGTTKSFQDTTADPVRFYRVLEQ
jgi:hypothetical protein